MIGEARGVGRAWKRRGSWVGRYCWLELSAGWVLEGWPGQMTCCIMRGAMVVVKLAIVNPRSGYCGK